MATYQGKDVTILRIAGRDDRGYDPRIPLVFIGDEDGERMVPRSEVDETDDMSDEERHAAEKALGKTDEQIRVDEIRRKARAEGRPPDQTPDPTIKTVTGRELPNPDAQWNDGTAPLLEQEKGNPTVRRPGIDTSFIDRGDPSGQGRSAADADKAQDEAKANKEAGDKATEEQDAERKRLEDEAKARQERGAGTDAEQRAAQADAQAGTQRGPAPDPQANPPPPGTPEGLGEDQRRERNQNEADANRDPTRPPNPL